MDKILMYIKKNLLTIIGIAVGGLGGYLYWRFVGCESGSCPITASPTLSVIWGMVMGGLLFSIFKKREK